jgi:hypothetical protein
VATVLVALLALPLEGAAVALRTPAAPIAGTSTSDVTRQVALWRAGSMRSVARSSARRHNAEVTLQARVTRAPNPSGALVMAYLRRSGQGEYRALVRVTRRGRVSVQAAKQRGGVVTPLGHERQLSWFRATRKRTLMIRARVIGAAPTRVLIRVWLKGQKEPKGWHVDARDTSLPLIAGTSGARVAVGAGSTLLPMRVAISGFRSRAIAAPGRPASRPTSRPTITGVRAYEVTGTSASVTWRVSQEATGQVEYGRTTSYGSRTTLEPSFDYRIHVQRIDGLQPGTVYHFRVRSRTRTGQLLASPDRTFRTLGATQPAPTPTPTPGGGAPTATPTATPSPTATPTPGGPQPTATPTPRPTPTPTPRPTATPTPRPTPTPTPRPTATPTPTSPSGTVTVPSSIDSSCGSNVGEALNSWINSQPAGSTLRFPSGACYRLGGDTGLHIRGRQGLTLNGTGVTLQLRTTGATNFSSGIFIQDSTNITVRGFSVIGSNTATGTTAAETVVDERINGALVRAGTRNIVLDGITIDRIYGFGILISDDGDGPWPDGVTIRNSRVRGGEMGIAVTAGRNIDIIGNSIEDTVYTAIDLEPDSPQHGYEDVLISDNDITNYGWAESMTSWFVAACPADSVVDDVTTDGLVITGNRIHKGPATANNGNYDGLGGLGIRIDKANLKRGVTITNNWTSDNDTQSSSRGVMYLANVNGLVVTGNTQPIQNGAALVRDSGTTGTRTIANNDTTP